MKLTPPKISTVELSGSFMLAATIILCYTYPEIHIISSCCCFVAWLILLFGVSLKRF
jgi:hypothetical protein